MARCKENLKEWESKFHRVGIRIPKELYKEVEIQLKKDNTTMNSLVTNLLTLFMEQRKNYTRKGEKEEN